MAKGKYQRWLEPDGLLLLEGWARDGLTVEQIAHNMGITAKTLYEWKNAHSEICEALKKGKEVARLISKDTGISFLTDSLTGILKKDYNEKDIRAERIAEKYENID